MFSTRPLTPTCLLNMVEAPLCSKKVLISASLKIQCVISIFFRLEADNQLYVKYKVRCDNSVLSFSKQKLNWLPIIKRRGLAQERVTRTTWPSFPITCRLLFIISTPKLVFKTFFIHKNCFELFFQSQYSFSILNLNLTYAVCRIR